MEINNGINIGSLFSINKSKSSPTAEIVEFECYFFKKDFRNWRYFWMFKVA